MAPHMKTETDKGRSIHPPANQCIKQVGEILLEQRPQWTIEWCVSSQPGCLYAAAGESPQNNGDELWAPTDDEVVENGST